MLPSPVTSTPFSVKDILKLEQQQQQQQQHAHPHPHPHAHSQPPEPRFHAPPPSCMLAAAESPGFSDGEENMSYLSALSVRDAHAEAGLSAELFAQSACLGHLAEAKLEGELEEQDTSERYKCKRQRQDKTLEMAGHHHPPPPRRVAVPVLVRDGKPCLGGSQNYNAQYCGATPYNYNGYPAYSYSNPTYNNSYSCTYSGIPALPPTTAGNAFMNVNLGNIANHISGSPQPQTHQGTGVPPCQGTLQGIRAW
ncbi:homeobox protein Nkx-2.3-like [Scleropages formosus]|uniref:Homeobox protein Nkx-2.3-like n=1 Tax=Scleropages formosus TaxID=113540 RepID=A0A0P7TUX9_SCLFO|nr:homeobox protein Nkx-2.3-like [Scleropages formosus]